nr:PREDICTED: ankyrin-3-like isoform X2 [Daucus carota subsp. sativus]
MQLDICTAERGHASVVKLLVEADPSDAYLPNILGKLPLYLAAEEGYNDVVEILCTTCTATSLDGPGGRSTALHAALYPAFQKAHRVSVLHLLGENKHLASFVDHQGWTPLHHAAYYEFDSILDVIITALKDVGYQFVYEDMITPFHLAAEGGYTSTVIRLMQMWPVSSSEYTAVNKSGQNILHLAATKNKKEMIQGILKYCPEQYKEKILNEQDDNGDTPVHILVSRGCYIPEVINHKGINTRVKNNQNWNSHDMLYLEDEIIADQTDWKMDIWESLVLPSKRQRKDMMFNKATTLFINERDARMKADLERYKNTRAVAHWFTDAIAGDANARAALEMEAERLNEDGETILHVESKRGDTERVRFIVTEFSNKDLLVKQDKLKQTALHLAAHHGHTQVVEVLIDAARRHLPSSSARDDTHNPFSAFKAFIRLATSPKQNTALHVAVLNGNVAIVKLLVEADPSDRHIQNYEGKTPIYIAAEKGYMAIIKEICTTCTAQCLEGPGGGASALHALIKNMQATEEWKDAVGMIIDAFKHWNSEEDALFNSTDEFGNTVLQLAVERNNVGVVKLLLEEDPAYQNCRGSKKHGLMRLIYKAIDNEYSTDIVKLLSETYEAGINPDHKGVLTLILAIKRRDKDSVLGLLKGRKHLVTFSEAEGWTPLHYAAYHEFVSILGPLIEAQKDVGYQFVYRDMVSTPFHVAVEHGYTSTVIQLVKLWPSTSSAYTAVNKDSQNILHLAAAKNNKNMVQGILKHCPQKYKDQLLQQQDVNGDTPLHLLISNGCFVPELIEHKGLNTMVKNKKSWTPRDMLYSKDDIIAEQVKIKIALDDVQSNSSRKFWRKSMKKDTDILESSVLPSKREKKDFIFDKYTKILIDEKNAQMKKDEKRSGKVQKEDQHPDSS